MKIIVNKIQVGKRILDIRDNMKLNLEDFGKIFNAEKSNVSKWERGLSLPNRARLEKIAKLGDMSVNELLYGSVEEFVRENYINIIPDYEFSKPASEFIKDIPISSYIEYLKKWGILEKKELINNIDSLMVMLNDAMENLIMELHPEERDEGFNATYEFWGELANGKNPIDAQINIMKKYNLIDNDTLEKVAKKQTDKEKEISLIESLLLNSLNKLNELDPNKQYVIKKVDDEKKTNPNQDNQ